MVTGPASLFYAAVRSVQLASSTVWQGAGPLGHAARSAATLVRTSSLAATSSGASMADVGHQVSRLLLFLPWLSVNIATGTTVDPNGHFFLSLSHCKGG